MSSSNLTAAAAAAAAAAASGGHHYHGYHGGGGGGNLLVSVPGSLKTIINNTKAGGAALKTAESKRRELVERSLKSHGVEEYTEQALDLLCALLSHEVQEHMTARRTLPTNALTIPSGGIVDAMTASSLALDITLPRSENRYNDAFSSVKRRRGVSGDVFEAVTRGADGMSTYAETVSGVNSEDAWEATPPWLTLSGDEFVTADAPMDGGSVENSSDYDASS
ncbi:hypothetical protein FOZ62_013415 [Perkinsus olseni]|uniref:Uncharacterized protein n=1 Tax=Perkinsus olseni TaxID=32597 RepID=A0A7J6TGD4_PEROL|nr:hypothetical protein FOZ62_013415 [Perkinsus olseni]